MFGIDDLAEGILGSTPLGLGVVAVTVAAVAVGPRAKPLAKNVIKGYFVATQRVREWTAESGERLQDLYAEAKYEYEAGLSDSQILTANAAGVPTDAGAVDLTARPATPSTGSGLLLPNQQPA